MKSTIFKAAVIATALVSMSTATAIAESAADFYKGKTVQIYIGYGLGGTYGKSATIMGAHLKPRIGADAVIVQSMPGAGGLKMTNYFYNVAAKDGTAIILPPDTLAITERLKPKKAKYESGKFTWLGSTVRSNSLMAIRSDSGVKSWKDLLTKEAPFAASGLGSQTYQIPALVNGLLNTKIKIVRGYKGSRKMLLAMEQGEVAGINLTWLAYKTNRKAWFDEGFAIPILQMGPVAEPEHPNVPRLSELVSAEDRPVVTFMSSLITIGRSLAMPPGTPSDRVAFLKAAFIDMAKDPMFVADMKKRKLEVTYTPAETVEEVVANTLAASPEIVSKVGKMLAGGSS